MPRENYKTNKRVKELNRLAKQELKRDLKKLKTQLREAVKKLRIESVKDDTEAMG